MKPLTLTAPEVRALLGDGQAVVSLWREIKPQPPTPEQFVGSCFGLSPAVADGIKMYSQNHYERLPKHPTDWEMTGSVGVARDAGFPMRYRCPWPIGSEWWVRETFKFASWGVSSAGPGRMVIRYAQDTAERVIIDTGQIMVPNLIAIMRKGHWRSPLTMPRWASRLSLRVVSVAVERDASGVWSWRVGVERIER